MMIGRVPGQEPTEEDRQAVRRFLQIMVAEALCELGPDNLSNEQFEEVVSAANRRMPALAKAVARKAVSDAIRETDPDSYSIYSETDRPASETASNRLNLRTVEANVAGKPSGHSALKKIDEIDEKRRLLDLPFISVDDAARVLDCSTDTVERLCKGGELVSKKVGRKRLVSTESICTGLRGGEPSACEQVPDLTAADLAMHQKLRRD